MPNCCSLTNDCKRKSTIEAPGNVIPADPTCVTAGKKIAVRLAAWPHCEMMSEKVPPVFVNYATKMAAQAHF